jgi:hypothetical protein
MRWSLLTWRVLACYGLACYGLACNGDGPPEVPPPGGAAEGILGTGWANPFPNAQLMGEDGFLSLRDLPELDSPLPTERLAWREGFSPAQVSVVRLGHLMDVEDIVTDGFPSHLAPQAGAGSVRMVDLTDGRPLLCFAELDAYPGADERALLVRPLEVLPDGHRIGVAILTDAMPRPAPFEALLQSEQLEASGTAEAYRTLLADLEAAGLPADSVALAWEFPVAVSTRPLVSALEQLVPPLAPPTFTEIRELDAGDEVPPYTWRAAEGTFRVQDFLVGDRSLVLGPDGSVTPQGETDAHLYVHIPTSVKDAPAGSVPVMVFGHGIFASPALYLGDDDDPSSVLKLAEEAGFIVVATTWRGLTTSDLIVGLEVAQDFSRFHELTDLLVQGQVNARTLVEGVSSGSLLADPVFSGAQGQPLPDPSQILYYGISLGAIEGAVMLANDPPIDGAVLHVGGAGWSTMLERSSNWLNFEDIISISIESAADRQVLYALSQLWWDPVDPMSWTAALSGRSLLLQESVGDEQVPNLATEAFARSIGLPVLEPTDAVPAGMSSVPGPLPPGSRALVRFDPQLPLPDPSNRPAAVTAAHTIPRTWPGTRLQVEDALTPGAEGQVVHHCGAAPCSADNPGEEP